MSEPVHIEVGGNGNVLYSRLVDSAAQDCPFDIAQVAAAPGDDLQIAGEKLRRELFRNPAIEKAVTKALNGSGPVYISATRNSAQAIWWEALYCDPPGFVTLDQRWPVARIASRAVPWPVRTFAPPLRVLAVISAAGQPGGAEWRALLRAANDARVAGLEVQLCVLTGERALRDEITQSALNWVELHPFVLEEFRNRVIAAQPHILHFFCHGREDAGGAWLMIAGGIEEQQLSIDDLIGWPELREAWLVALNCCGGAAAVGDAPSMAFRLVNSGKVPFAIGAADLVDVLDANALAAAFYGRLFALLARDFGHGHPQGGSRALDLGEALLAAREAIAARYDNDRAGKRHWMLPILYQHLAGLQLQQTQQAAPSKTRSEMAAQLAEFLSSPGIPDDIKRTLISSILGQP